MLLALGLSGLGGVWFAGMQMAGAAANLHGVLVAVDATGMRVWPGGS